VLSWCVAGLFASAPVLAPAPVAPTLPKAPAVAPGQEQARSASPFPPEPTASPPPATTSQAATPPRPPTAQSTTAPSMTTAPAPGTRSAPWSPPEDLIRVPFPLERSEASRKDAKRRRRPPIVDLRDPFVTAAHSRPVPAHLRARLLPELKDPFLAPRHPRPDGWKVALPGDIRDPFAERTARGTPECEGGQQTTADGVLIQRPGQDPAPDQPVPPDQCKRVVRPMPADLQDPFRARG
jgi:hypothetical protein